MNPGDKAYLKLHAGYKLPGKPNKKISNQRCPPFLVKRRIDRLAYELDLPPKWKVHPVISVSQLESYSGPNPYNRPRPDYPNFVYVEGDTPDNKSYEVKDIVVKRVRKYGKTAVTKYMMKFKEQK